MSQIMRFVLVPCVAFLALPVATTQLSSNNQGAAIQKVVVMLTDMTAKAKKDKQAEEVQHSEFSEWCTNQKASLSAQIKTEAAEVTSLSAAVGKLNSDAKTLGTEIAGLQGNVEQFEADKKATTEQRAKDHKAFLAEQQDYGESIDALARAIIVLQKQSYDRTALLQLADSQQLPTRARQMVTAFAGMIADDDEDAGFLGKASPQANAYEFQSTNIVDLLKKLKDDFTAKQGECEKEEMNSKHAADMIVQDLTSSTDRSSDDINSKSSLRQEKLQKSTLHDKTKTSTSSMLAEDQQTLAETSAECAEKKESFAEKQRLRADELDALEKAIEILSSEAVQASGEKYLSLSQAAHARVLLQSDGADAASADSEGIRRRLRDFLMRQGERLHSAQLGLLAEKIAADPFAKVKKLIDNMITRLLEEANGDADHEGFCDKEVGQSKITRSKLTEEIDGLSAEVDNGQASIVQLGQEVAALSKDIAELEAAVTAATSMRAAEKDTNANTVKDSEEAMKAVEAAVAVLKDFYAKAGGATAFIQVSDPIKVGSESWNALANPDFEGTVDKGHKEGMQTFGGTYSGQQDEAGGVLAMLDVIASDFATLKADTESTEGMSQKAYEAFMTESKKDKATKARGIEMRSSDKVSAEAKLRDDTADMKFAQDKLLAADRYYEKLKPQCVDEGMTFEERSKARQEEITSLKEALKILEGEDIPTSAL